MKYESDRRRSPLFAPIPPREETEPLVCRRSERCKGVLMPDTVLSAGTGTGPVSKPTWRRSGKGRSVEDDVSGGAE